MRWRAVALGVLLATWINATDPISSFVIHSSPFANSHIPFTLLLGVLVLGYLYNPIVRRFLPGWALNRQDLAAVLAVGFLGGAVPSMGARFVGVLSAPDYFAAPENEWPVYVLPNLQKWLFPSNVGGGVSTFYRGLAPGDFIPWKIWVGPLFWWFSLVGCIVLACFCLSVILRKSWSNNERLAYPWWRFR